MTAVLDGQDVTRATVTVTFMSRQSRIRYHLTASLLGTLSWELEETL